MPFSFYDICGKVGTCNCNIILDRYKCILLKKYSYELYSVGFHFISTLITNLLEKLFVESPASGGHTLLIIF